MDRIARCLALLALVASAWAAAQDSPVRIMVGFPPGGGTDVVARMVADKMKDSLGTAVVIENRPGAGGQVAAKLFKAAAPDGRTLMATASAPITLAAFQRLDYDPVKDFAPVSLAATFDLVFVVGPGSPARTFEEYVAWIKADAQRRTFGSAASGSLPHLLGALLGRSLGVEMLHVPYNGGAPLLTALAGGQVPAGIMLFTEALPMHQAGKVAILASAGPARAALAPEVPTFAQLGFPEIAASGWIAFYVPANTAKPAIARLSEAIAHAVRSTDVAQKLVNAGYEPVGSTPDMLARRMTDDMQKWGPVARSLGLGDK